MNRDDFLAFVADEARVDMATAEDLVHDFLQTIQGYVTPPAWEVLVDLTPLETAPDSDRTGAIDSPTIDDFLVDLSGEEDVAERTAARHARAVAMALERQASADQLSELTELIPEDLLALFENYRRGEMTSAEPEEGP